MNSIFLDLHKICLKNFLIGLIIDSYHIHYECLSGVSSASAESLILSSDNATSLRLLLYQKIGIAGTGVLESAPTLAAAAEENRCE